PPEQRSAAGEARRIVADLGRIAGGRTGLDSDRCGAAAVRESTRSTKRGVAVVEQNVAARLEEDGLEIDRRRPVGITAEVPDVSPFDHQLAIRCDAGDRPEDALG